MILIPFSPSWVHYTVCALFVFCIKLSVLDTTELEQLLAAAVVDALNAAHIEWKTAAAIMRIDYAQMTRQFRAEPHQHISLTRLIRLPMTFWLAFTPALISLVFMKRMQEIRESISDLKRSA